MLLKNLSQNSLLFTINNNDDNANNTNNKNKL